MERVDLLICGAGPVGLTLAVECARHGVSFIIVDKNLERRPFSKALAVWSNTLETLDAMGVIEHFFARGTLLKQFIFYKDKQAGKPVKLAHKIPSKFPFPLIIPQTETERILEERLEALGHKVMRGLELVALVEEEDQVTATIKAKGRETHITASWIAGCDGAHSTVRHLSGIAFEGYADPESFLICDAEIEGDLPKHTAMVNWDMEKALGLLPMGRGHFRIISGKSRGDTDEKPPTLEEIKTLLSSSNFPPLQIKSSSWLAQFSVHERVAATFTKGRAFLLGDAAHIHSPAGGQGMNTGIQDAYNLAWKIKHLVNYPSTSALICESYNAERRPVALHVVKSAALKQHVMINNSFIMKAIKRFFFNILPRFSFVARRLILDLSGVNIHYHKSPLIEKTINPIVGSRVRDFPVLQEGALALTSTHDIAATGHHLLLIRGTQLTPPNLPSDIKICFIKNGLRVPGLPLKKGEWMLIRPDLYIASKGPVLDWTMLYDYSVPFWPKKAQHAHSKHVA